MIETSTTKISNNYAILQTPMGKNFESSSCITTGIVNCNDQFVYLYFSKFNIKNGIKVIVEDQMIKIEPPQIVDVNIIVPDKVVEVTFVDGTKEKSVCKEPDVFSLETAISICISKKIMGGSGAYNKAVKCSMKVYQDKLKKEAAEKEERERIVKKREKRLAYKEHRSAKKAEKEKERQIEIQKEAYLRAMKEFEKTKLVVKKETI